MEFLRTDSGIHYFTYECWQCPCNGEVGIPKGTNRWYCPESCGAIYELQYPSGDSDPEISCLSPSVKLKRFIPSNAMKVKWKFAHNDKPISMKNGGSMLINPFIKIEVHPHSDNQKKWELFVIHHWGGYNAGYDEPDLEPNPSPLQKSTMYDAPEDAFSDGRKIAHQILSEFLTQES